MTRRVTFRAAQLGLFIAAAAFCGCANQREAFFPPAKPGSLFAPKTSAAGSAQGRTTADGSKPGRVDHSALRPSSRSETDRFDFDYYRD